MNFYGLALATLASAVSIALLRRSSMASRLADHPNERSLHFSPTPRLGGLGLLAGAAPVAAAYASTEGVWLLALAGALAALSAIDDARSLPVTLRLACHLTAALAAAAIILSTGTALRWPLPVAVAGVGALAVAWMSNLFNFMDGADGLAGGMSLIGFGALAFAAHRAGAPDVGMAAGAISAASIGFLAFNLPPARVYLGDAGSVPIGFLAGALGMYGIQRDLWPTWFPVLVFSPFVVDATLTVVHRLAAGEPAWLAHRSHYYQRLVLGGWSHRRLALTAWGLMLAVAISALVAREGSTAAQGAILAAWALAYCVLAVGIDRRHPRKQARGAL